MNLPIPKTQLEKTLYYLITKRVVNTNELRRLTLSSYPPVRIQDCEKLGVRVLHDKEKIKGKDYTVAKYTLLSPMKQAKEIYLKLKKAA